MRKIAFAALLVTLLLSLAGCQTLEIRIDATPSPDAHAIGTLAALMLEGTRQARLATERAIPPTPTPPASLVKGRLCYPAERIPPMTIYFRNLATDALTTLEIVENQSSYEISLPPGRYYAYAWVDSFNLGGLYSQYVVCGYGAGCTDHSPAIVEAAVVRSLDGIDLCDWPYSPTQLPLAPGQSLGGE